MPFASATQGVVSSAPYPDVTAMPLLCHYATDLRLLCPSAHHYLDRRAQNAAMRRVSGQGKLRFARSMNGPDTP
eukprot:4295142-Pyramimonas_sp.AAC.1